MTTTVRKRNPLVLLKYPYYTYMFLSGPHHRNRCAYRVAWQLHRDESQDLYPMQSTVRYPDCCSESFLRVATRDKWM